MKFDGHVKLTSKALTKVKQSCPTDTSTCNAPMFKQEARIWLGDSKKSNTVDNYSSAVINYIGHALAPDVVFQIKLPDATAFVDLDHRWTHDDPKGQRFHFMRAENETEKEAYLNAIKFIKTHTENWVNAAKDIIKQKSKPKPLQSATWRETRDYVKELALALHCLQDSFSPGHTQRYFDVQSESYPPGFYDRAAPIRKIFVYAHQDHEAHGDEDYRSGGTDSSWGNIAVNASAALITKGILSIPSEGRGLIGWDDFVNKWLSHKLY